MSTESNIQLTLGSLFSGSGGFELGGLLTGNIVPVFNSEIEPLLRSCLLFQLLK